LLVWQGSNVAQNIPFQDFPNPSAGLSLFRIRMLVALALITALTLPETPTPQADFKMAQPKIQLGGLEEQHV
jgi:hypothetical protein